ncbi:HNH endonuclease [Bacillus subtilis]|uniref:HNH endonuclease n=1 Tax=Bacillus subtilis group TaxID=653685 RepID=UPI002ED63508
MNKIIENNGYITVYMPSHHRAKANGMVYEHIVEVEKKLGRLLKENEVVHHEDENRQNNKIENLFVFKSASDHTRFHKTGRRIKVNDYYISPPIMKECLVCNEKFEYVKNNKESYCSKKCLNVAKRKVDRPNKEELFKLIKEKSFLEIGRDFGVSDNTIRKWCKGYELPYRKKDIK